jgi:hypothetical protein
MMAESLAVPAAAVSLSVVDASSSPWRLYQHRMMRMTSHELKEFLTRMYIDFEEPSHRLFEAGITGAQLLAMTFEDFCATTSLPNGHSLWFRIIKWMQGGFSPPVHEVDKLRDAMVESVGSRADVLASSAAAAASSSTGAGADASSSGVVDTDFGLRVRRWCPDEVMEFFAHLEYAEEGELLREHGIDGERLLSMTEEEYRAITLA